MKYSGKWIFVLTFILFTAAMVFYVSGCSSTSPANTIAGVISDENGDPIEKVSLTVSGRTGTSDSQGRYAVTELSGGSNDLKAEKTGYKTYSATVNINSNPGLYNFKMESLFPLIESINPSEGYEGTEITLTGKRFGDEQGDSTLTLAGTAVTEITSWSDTEIKFNVPKGAKSGAVIVTVNSLSGNEDKELTVYGLYMYLSSFSSPATTGTPAGIFGKQERETPKIADGCIFGFNFDTLTGSLTELSTSPTITSYGAAQMASSPDGRFLYVGHDAVSSVNGFAVNSETGELSEVPGSPITMPNIYSGAAVHPNGKFAYFCSFQDDKVLGYSIDQTTGELKILDKSPLLAMDGSFFLTFSTRGEYLYTTGRYNNIFDASKVDPDTGYMTSLSGSPYATGTTPIIAATDPAGKFVFITNSKTNNVSVFSIDSSTGILTEVSGSPFDVGTGPFGLCTDLSGKYLYVVNMEKNIYADGTSSIMDTNGNITTYSIDSETGKLTEIFSPMELGTNCYKPVIDPTGKYLFVGNSTSGTLSAFSVNRSTGELRELSYSPLTTEGKPFDSHFIKYKK